MMHKWPKQNRLCRNPLATAALVGMVGWATLAMADDFELTWYTIDGGGVTVSTGWELELGGTIGQADPTVMTGGDFTLSGGYWAVALTSNQDNCGVGGNLESYEGLQACLFGPDAMITISGCSCYDFDDDGDTDLRDYHAFQLMIAAS